MSLSSRNFPKKERKNGSYGGYEGLEVANNRPQPFGHGSRSDQYQEDTSALSALQNVQNEAAKLKEQVSRIGLRAGDAKNHESRANQLARQLQEKEQENTLLRSDKNEVQENKETLEREKGALQREKKQLQDGKEEAERENAKLQAEKNQLQEAKQKADQENENLRLMITRLEAQVKQGDTKLQKQMEEERKLRDETKKLVQEMHALFATLKSSNDYISELQL